MSVSRKNQTPLPRFPITQYQSPPASRAQTILIVEPDHDTARYYASIFENSFKIINALSGHQTIRLTKQSEDIHLVILEHRLRDMSGLDVLKEIKKHRPSVPVIMVTAYGDESVAVKAFRYGAKDYLRKPVAYNELRGRVAFCLSLRHADKVRRKVEYTEEDQRRSSSTLLKNMASRRQLNIQNAMRYIDDNFMTCLDRESIAQKACMSIHHFSRVFKKATNVTFQEYVIQRRVEKAKTLLLDPRRTVAEIANSVGYLDPNNLIRNFKKLTGCTPTEFRNGRAIED